LEFLETQQQQMDRIFVGTVILLCSALLAYGLFYSNRIAGPIYHLRNYLRAYAKGRVYGELQFREGDFFSDLEPVVNAALRTEKIERDKKAS
jgi:hypothetical protein